MLIPAADAAAAELLLGQSLISRRLGWGAVAAEAAAPALGVSAPADSDLGLGLRGSGAEEAGEAGDHFAIAVEDHEAGFVAAAP